MTTFMRDTLLTRFRPLGLILALPLAACADGSAEPAAGGATAGAAERIAVGAADRGPAAAAETTPTVIGLGDAGAAPPVTDTIDMRRIGYSRGAEDAPVQVFEFSDFGCPYCGQFAVLTYPELHEEFVRTGLVRWTYVPFVMGMFPNGAEAARAAECAAEQDAFWPMHDRLYEGQREWKPSRSPRVLFAEYARELGLSVEGFAACYDQDLGGARTALNNRAATGLGVRATPSFFVNGRLVEGALPADRFRQILEMSGARRDAGDAR